MADPYADSDALYAADLARAEADQQKALGLQGPGDRAAAQDRAMYAAQEAQKRYYQRQDRLDAERQRGASLSVATQYNGLDLSSARQALGISRGGGGSSASIPQEDPLEAQNRQTVQMIRAYMDAGDEQNARELFGRNPHLWEGLGVPRSAYEADPVTNEAGGIGLRASNIDRKTGNLISPGIDMQRLKPALDAYQKPTPQVGISRLGQTERIAQRIMEEAAARGEQISFQDAVSLSRRAPDEATDALRREGLALSAAKGDLEYSQDPEGTIGKWRVQYGAVQPQNSPVPQGLQKPQQAMQQRPVEQQKYTSPDDIKAAYKAGDITREQAKSALSQFGYK